MFKINNKKINSIVFYGLVILTILIFVVAFMPFNEVLAQRYDSRGFLPVTGYVRNSGYNSSPNTVIGYSDTPVVYSNSSSVNRTGTNTVTVKKIAGAKTATETKPADGNSLVANAIYGSNSFMPSGLIQWIFFGILILIAVILIRRVTGARDRYHAEPLKHA